MKIHQNLLCYAVQKTDKQTADKTEPPPTMAEVIDVTEDLCLGMKRK